MPEMSSPAAWSADPTGRHEYRYWDGAAWTDHVSDHGVQGIDPVFSAPGAVPAVPARAAGRVDVRDAPSRAMGRRYGAFFIDLVIAVVAFTIIFFPLATKRTVAETLRLPGCHFTGVDNNQVSCTNRTVIRIGDTVYEANGGPTFVLDLLFGLLYFGVLQGLTGATVGKRATGIRVVRADGTNAGVGRSVIRWLLLAVDGPLTLFLCGVITSAVSRGHRRLGDMAAGTYVVPREDAGYPIEL
jgi:uncharacterized RDD family membrane protein YckC